MAAGTLLLGRSYSTLESRAFSIAEASAANRPRSILWLEATDAVRETTRDRWTADQDRHPLQLEVGTLDDFVSQVYEILLDASPQVETVPRQRSIEAALRSHDGFDDGQRYADGFSELLREIEADGMVTEEAVAQRLSSSELPEAATEALLEMHTRYRAELPELGLDPSTVSEHLQRAERNLLSVHLADE